MIKKQPGADIYRAFALICIMIFNLFTLASCTDSRTKALNEYREKMEAFFENVSAYDTAINAIDTNADDAKTKLLEQLDGLNAEFNTLREIDIPDEFAGIADISIEAADYMQKANELYHEAYDGEYNATASEEAYLNYEKANKCLKKIIEAFNGEA